MNWIIIITVMIALCNFGCNSTTFSSKNRSGFSNWSVWSSCSTSCGEGVRQRVRRCPIKEKRCRWSEKETTNCFLRFCPSYLTWPRIHFSGTMVADVTTVNNIRCAYDNEQFSAALLSKHYVGLQEQDGTHTYYKKATGNWNPDGSNQVYFQDTFVTSLCFSPNVCLTNDSIVGLKVTEVNRGVMAVLDVDWQYATEIYGLKIRIPGVLEGDFEISSHQIEAARLDSIPKKDVGYSIPLMSRYKSALANVTWNDPFYKKLFNNAEELSISFIIDLYNQISQEGRISGTIGLTSPCDSKEMMVTRTVRPWNGNIRGSSPFFIHYDEKVLTFDLGYAIGGREDGRILADDTGKLDLAVLLSRKTYCKYFSHERQSNCIRGADNKEIIYKPLTTGGELSRRIGNDGSWYLTFGGVMDIDLKHLDWRTWNLLRNSRIAIMEQKPDGTESIYMAEFPKGIVIGLKNDPIVRLNPGENITWYGYVSSYGRPAKNVRFDVSVAQHIGANTDCGRPSCNMTNGVPVDALQIVADNPFPVTNASGLIKFVLKAVKDPGNIRGCGLDGQLYPLKMVVRYKTGTRTITFTESGTYAAIAGADFSSRTLSIATLIYNNVPEKKCPTWNDVKNIFIQYYNLYPVMWKNGIVDLHSYDAVVKKSKMIIAAMFEADINDRRYMPISRDLSAGKKKLIWNWIQCGMKQSDPQKSKKQESTLSTEEFMKQEITELQLLLQKAVILELSTIPPYVTAWLSLKTEYGRNREISQILKSVFNEEMLHMSLAGNILNAVGGVVNITDETKLPIYPTILASGDSYQLCPDMQVSLNPFSIGLVEDVFSEIEKPADSKTRELVYGLAEIWKMLPENDEVTEYASYKMKKLIDELELKRNMTNHDDDDHDKIPRHGNFTKPPVTLLKTWQKLKDFSQQKIYEASSAAGKTVGELYIRIAFRLTFLESSLRIENLKSIINGDENINNLTTIFIGNPRHQLNMSHWYEDHAPFPGKENLNEDESYNHKSSKYYRPPLFEVSNLKNALEAIVEILYQGEGGSECSPFVTEPLLYSSNLGRKLGHEISHYYRFQEIANGRKLARVKYPPDWVDWKCLNATHDGAVCPSFLDTGELYCYVGTPITFYEDGVWPILPNPDEGQYLKGSKAYKLHHQFNLLYTRLLFCLQDAFGGDPSKIKSCMTIMYDLTITGKRLVQTPLRVAATTSTIELGYTGYNGSPTWLFVREKPFRAGLPLRM